jgi:outer membrane lipoprotein-sorting protein
MTQQDPLGQNIRSLLKSNTPPAMPEQAKAAVLEVLLQETATPLGGSIMKANWIKYMIAAMIIGCVILGMLWMSPSSTAFAQVLEHFQERGYRFTYWRQDPNGTRQRMGRAMVLQPGLLRWDMPGDQWQGLALVIDTVHDETRWVTLDGKNLGTVDAPELMRSDLNIFSGPIETLWNLADGNETPLGDETMDGIEVTGFRVGKTLSLNGQTGQIMYTIWANTETGVPHEVHMEIKAPTGEKDVTVYKEFDFDSTIDETLFGLGPETPVEAPNDGRFVIKPLVGMGDLRLGDTQEKIEQVFGKPDFRLGDAIRQYAGFVVTIKDDKVYTILCGDATGVDTRFVKDCFCKTVEGIGMGATEEAIMAAYGEPTRKIDDHPLKGGFALGYRAKGLVFGLYNNKVHFIQIQTPRPPKE